MQRGSRLRLSAATIAMHFGFKVVAQLLVLSIGFAEPHNQCVKGIGDDFAC